MHRSDMCPYSAMHYQYLYVHRFNYLCMHSLIPTLPFFQKYIAYDFIPSTKYIQKILTSTIWIKGNIKYFVLDLSIMTVYLDDNILLHRFYQIQFFLL
jgi:hypothetical protein